MNIRRNCVHLDTLTRRPVDYFFFQKASYRTVYIEISEQKNVFYTYTYMERENI